MNRRLRSALTILTATGALLALAAPAGAATIKTTTTADEFNTGAGCSLREAIQAANTNAAFGGCPAGSGPDSIPLVGGTYALSIAPDATPDDNTDGDLDIVDGSQVTMFPASSKRVILDGGGIDRVLHIIGTSGSADISRVTVRNGVSAGAGAGILVFGSLNLRDSTVNGNRSTASFGGGIAHGGTGATLTNVTVSGNVTASDSGGIDQDSTFPLTLNNVTVTGNTSNNGGGIHRENGVINVRNSIIAGNTDAPGGERPDCSNLTASLGNNLIGNTLGCGYVAAPGDKVGAPLLGPLADNGGPAFTHALLAGSPALDAAGPGATPTDERGVTRVQPDMGAYERVICGGAVVNRVGTAGKDKLKGTPGADGILGLKGKDTLLGLAGKDGLCGGSGNDVLKGGNGKDRLIGQKGKDRMFGGKGNDSCKGGSGRDEEASC